MPFNCAFPLEHGHRAHFATLADFKTVEPVGPEDELVAKVVDEKKRGLFRRMGAGVRDYVKRLAFDYGTVAKDIVQDSRKRPIKAAAYGAALLGLVYTFQSNPDERELHARLADLRQQMVLIPSAIHSPKADAFLERYTDLLNGRRLDVYNFWLFSLLIERHYDRKSNFYAAMDRTLRHWPWTELWQNCFDIGAFGRFWLLERAFQECDVAEE